MPKPKLLPQSDVKEVVRFQEYLRDLEGDMPHQDFANKYSDYLGMTESTALAGTKKEK